MMISDDEAAYLRRLGSETWSGEVDVVEVGPWLGGSTWCLATGMRANPRRDPGSRLHVLDDFRWRAFMADCAPLALEPGDSFRGEFERNLASLGELLAIHEARLPDGEFSARVFAGSLDQSSPPDDEPPRFSGESLPRPVGIAFVDGAKSWRAFRSLLGCHRDWEGAIAASWGVERRWPFRTGPFGQLLDARRWVAVGGRRDIRPSVRARLIRHGLAVRHRLPPRQ